MRPQFENDEATKVWFDENDTALFMDEMETVELKLPIVRTIFPTKPVDIRLRTDYLEAIQEIAERQGIPYQKLVQRWLMEKLSQEVPDLVIR